MKKPCIPVLALLSFMIALPSAAEEELRKSDRPQPDFGGLGIPSPRIYNQRTNERCFNRYGERRRGSEFEYSCPERPLPSLTFEESETTVRENGRETRSPDDVDTALCREQVNQRNPDVIRICEEEGGFEYDWVNGRVISATNILDFRRFTVINNSPYDITAIEAWPGLSSRSSDMLTISLDTPLRSGQSSNILLRKPDCLYHFNITTSDNAESSIPVMDTCINQELELFASPQPTLPPSPSPGQRDIEIVEQCMQGLLPSDFCFVR